MVDLHRLESLVAFLSIDARYFDLLDAPGESVDLRWLPFISTGNVRVEIWYSVVEDDLAVYLESVEIIRPPQQTPP